MNNKADKFFAQLILGLMLMIAAAQFTQAIHERMAAKYEQGYQDARFEIIEKYIVR